MGDNSEGYHDLDAEINIVPLVDVVLVLLIIFMIAAPLSISTIKVNLPETSNKPSLKQEPELILGIKKNGNYYLGKQKIDKKTFVAKLAAIYETRRSKVLYIQADKNLLYKEIVLAMNGAHEAGIKKISLLTKQMSAAK